MDRGLIPATDHIVEPGQCRCRGPMRLERSAIRRHGRPGSVFLGCDERDRMRCVATASVGLEARACPQCFQLGRDTAPLT